MASGTVTCRGIPLLGITTVAEGCGQVEETTFVPVHQLSIELWRLFSTPRVSVQKKIRDLNIRPCSCTKEQVKLLRKHKIIGGFRATLISLRDAEKLCDALRLSRENRGLERHCLKPSSKAVRTEEKWLRQFTARKKRDELSIMTTDITGSFDEKNAQTGHEEGGKGSVNVDECALIGGDNPPTLKQAEHEQAWREETPPVDLSPRFYTLLVADSPTRLIEEEEICNHKVLKIVNEYCENWEQSVEISDSCMESIGRLGTLRSHHVAAAEIRNEVIDLMEDSYPSPLPSTCVHVGQGRTQKLVPPQQLTPPAKRTNKISSAARKEMNLVQSSQSFSSNGLLTSFVPDLDKGKELSSSSHPNLNVWQSNHDSDNGGKQYRPRSRRVIPTKLRHFAQTKSPNTSTVSPGKYLPFGSSPLPAVTGLSQSFVISIPRSLIKDRTNQSRLHENFPLLSPKLTESPQPMTTQSRRTKPHSTASSLSGSPKEKELSQSMEMQAKKLEKILRVKPTTLSTFATKKRALSPPSAHPNFDMSSSPKRAKQCSMEANGVLNGLTTAELSSMPPNLLKCLPKPGKELSGKTFVQVLSTSVNEAMVASEPNIKRKPVHDIKFYNQGSIPNNVVSSEEDRGSLSSSSTVSSSDGKGEQSKSDTNVKATSNLATISTLATNHGKPKQDKNQRETGFSLNAIFNNGPPPRFVVKDGELCPEVSLSLSGLDRAKLNSLPPTHHLWNWSLGQPTKRPTSTPFVKVRRKLRLKNHQHNSS